MPTTSGPSSPSSPPVRASRSCHSWPPTARPTEYGCSHSTRDGARRSSSVKAPAGTRRSPRSWPRCSSRPRRTWRMVQARIAAMVLYGRRLLVQDEPVDFQHSFAIRRDYPQLVAGVLVVSGVTASAEVAVDSLLALARARLASTTESAFPEIQAWRRVFASMGLKPTQYRCAAESLLRRFRREDRLPRVHPLVDLCNAVSLAYAIPIAALDIAKVTGDLEVRYATGKEEYLTFGGEIEQPE